MAIAPTRSQVRLRLRRTIREQQAHLRRDMIAQERGPYPLPEDYVQRDHRADVELTAHPEDTASMRVMVRASMLYQSGLERITWPEAGAGEADRYSPYFQAPSDADYRVDLLYLTHYNTLAIAQGTGIVIPLLSSATVFDGATLPTMPSRGVPLAYIILFADTEAIEDANIVEVRPLVVGIGSEDIDVEMWMVFQDFSALCDGSATMFAFDLPVAGERGIVKMNGLVQQPGVAYDITHTGGSLALTFTPEANEILTAEHELGDKENYSGWGLAPWDTGLYGV